MYTAFIHAFPASWSAFDDEFKDALVEVVYLWQAGETKEKCLTVIHIYLHVFKPEGHFCTPCSAGIKPQPGTWRKWDFAILDPPNSLRTIGKDDQLAKSPRLANSEHSVQPLP